RGRRLRLSREAVQGAGSPAGDPRRACASRRAPGAACGDGVAHRGARGAEGDRAREGPADGEGEPHGAAGVRAPAEGEPGVAAASAGDRGGRRPDARRSRLMPEDHPNAALPRRVFDAFGKNAMQISAALTRDIVWRVPGNGVMSGEYRGRRDVVEFLRRTGLE